MSYHIKQVILMLYLFSSTDEIAQSIHQEVPVRSRWASSVSLETNYEEIHLLSLWRDGEFSKRPTQSKWQSLLTVFPRETKDLPDTGEHRLFSTAQDCTWSPAQNVALLLRIMFQ